MKFQTELDHPLIPAWGEYMSDVRVDADVPGLRQQLPVVTIVTVTDWNTGKFLSHCSNLIIDAQESCLYLVIQVTEIKCYHELFIYAYWHNAHSRKGRTTALPQVGAIEFCAGKSMLHLYTQVGVSLKKTSCICSWKPRLGGVIKFYFVVWWYERLLVIQNPKAISDMDC